MIIIDGAYLVTKCNISGLDKTTSQRHVHRLDISLLRSNTELHCCKIHLKCYLLYNLCRLQPSNKLQFTHKLHAKTPSETKCRHKRIIGFFWKNLTTRSFTVNTQNLENNSNPRRSHFYLC